VKEKLKSVSDETKDKPNEGKEDGKEKTPKKAIGAGKRRQFFHRLWCRVHRIPLDETKEGPTAQALQGNKRQNSIEGKKKKKKHRKSLHGDVDKMNATQGEGTNKSPSRKKMRRVKSLGDGDTRSGTKVLSILESKEGY